MAKIVLAFTRPSKEYSQPVADALIRDLDGLVQKLNSTFQQDLREETQRLTWFSTGEIVANRYKNAQFDLTSTNKTDIYTCPSNSRAIVQNIHTANVGSGNVEIKAFIYDNSATTSFQFAEHTVNSGDSKSIADGTIILEENDKLQLQAATADIFEGTVAILEFDRT